MENQNKLNEISLAKIDETVLGQIKKLEQELGEKYYIIAFEK